MNWKKAIGFGILIWLIMFAVVCALLGWYNQFIWMKIIVVIIGVVVVFIVANYAAPRSAGQALGYGLVWVIIAIILDALITMRFNAVIFTSKTLWLSYFLTLVVPLLRIKKPAQL